ncbi:ornithine decarboxylase antizyme-domain-containing protein [Lentinula aciculospora]|uniref:Ornithine decarboxylase antizyme n=1 Tax=Lentinula aciculospora TaxID=153920 RepID=A0A9W8ZVP3_9AGAR|nr:ornithine decarboxylase antizyme-domain-containing protein [Lentinula aciculospora]
MRNVAERRTGGSRRLQISVSPKIVAVSPLRFSIVNPQITTLEIFYHISSWHMSLKNNSNITNQRFSLCPTNGRQTVGDGAVTLDTPSVLAVCQMQGTDDMYYYSTTFSGGPGVSVCGAFDTPKAKCPPDRGSSECVTGNPAPPTSKTSISSPKNDYNFSYLKQHTPARGSFPFPKTAPGPYVIPARSSSGNSDLSTPPLTPDGGSDCSDRSISPASSQQNDALDFLLTLFPSGLGALAYAKNISISAPNMGSAFNGMVLELPGKPRTLYVDAKSAESVSLRESIVALLDLADDQLECSALVIVLERSSPSLGEILHSLMYVGGSVVTKPPFPVDNAFVLVGLEM